jgi:hypothetical protein
MRAFSMYFSNVEPAATWRVKNYFPPSFGKPTSDGMDEEWAVNYRQSRDIGKLLASA